MVRNARRKLLALTGGRKDFDWDAQVIAITRLLQYVWGGSHYLTGISTRQIQHVEEEAKLAGQAELLLAQMILDETADWLQEI